MKLSVMIQNHPGENAQTALWMMLAYYKKYVSIQDILEVCVPSRSGVRPGELCEAAKYYGMDVKLERINVQELKLQPCPFVVQWKKKYYVIVSKIQKDKITVVDPAKGEYTVTVEKFESAYSGLAISMKPGKEFVADGKKVTLIHLLRNRFLGYEKAVIVALVLNLVITGIHMLMLKLTQKMLDDVMSGEYPERYTGLLIAMSIVLICGTIASVFSLLSLNHTSRRMAAQSGAGLYKHLFRLPLNFFEQHSAGELIERVEKNIQLDHSLLQQFFPRIVDGVMVFFYLFMMFYYEVRLAFVCVVIEIIYILVSAMIQQKKSLVLRSVTASSGALNASLLNGLGMIETLKTTGAERKFFALWHANQNQFDDNRNITQKLDILSAVTASAHTVLTSAFLLTAGSYFIINGEFTLGMLSVFQTVLGNARTALGNCISTVNNIQSMRTNIERVEDITSRPVREENFLDKDEEPDKLRGEIRLEHISYRYAKGDNYAVKDVSFEVKSGQMVALVGATGCGKSTLLKIIADMYTADAGEIYYDGRKRCEIPDVVFHSSVASVDQETVMFEESISDNLKMWDHTVEDYEMILAARDAHIHNRIVQEKKKYNSPIKENGKNFSGGELQRMELARALAQEPTLLLLDEFTSALDARTEEQVFQAIRDKGTTCVIVAHRLSTIVECDHIIVLQKGKIVQQGTHMELSQTEGLYKDLICMQ